MTALELRRAAISAEAERARHGAIVDSARDFAIIVADLEGLITDWSAGAQTIFGWVENEGEPIATIFTTEDRPAGVPGKRCHRPITRGGGG